MLTSVWSSQRSASLVLRLRPSANGHQGAEPSADISPPFLSILQSGRHMLQGLCNFQRSASLVLRLRPSANGHQGAEPSTDISPPFLSILQSGRPMLQGVCNSQRSASLILHLQPSANGHQGGGAIRSTVLSHHGKPTGNTKREYASTLTRTRLPI